MRFLRALRRRQWQQLFVTEVDTLPAPRRFLIRAARLLFITGRKFIRDLCFERSASLAFMTSAAIIPASILLFSVFRSFGAEEQLEGWRQSITSQLAQYASDEGQLEATRFIDQLFVSIESQARGVQRLALVFLVIAVLSLYRSVERSFSAIWGVPASRNVLRKLGSLWLFVTAAPLFLAGAVLVRESLAASIGGLVTWLYPVVMSAGGFALLYIAMPNTRVAFVPALLGATLAAIAWLLATSGFSFYVREAALTGIYGALGVIPFFLLWIYMSWVIVLFGAVLTSGLQHYRSMEREVRFQIDCDKTLLPVLALVLLEWVYARFRAGEEALDLEPLAASTGAPHAHYEACIATLLERGLLARDEAGLLTPRRAPEHVSVLEVMNAFPTGTGHHLPTGLRNCTHGVPGLMRDLAQRTRAELAGITYADLALPEPSAKPSASPDTHPTDPPSLPPAQA